MKQKLVSGARCAIRMRIYETDVKKAVELLSRDLLNGPLHCFGIHSHCSADFGEVVREKQEPTSLSNSNTQNSQSESSSNNDDQPASSSSIFNESGYCSSDDENDDDIEGMYAESI